MTQPISHGYPDYGRYSATSDIEIADIVADVVNPNRAYGPFFVGHTLFMCLSMTATTGRFNYLLSYSKDNPSTKVVASQQAVAPQGGPSRLVFPVLGPWLTITATPHAAPGTHTMYAFTVPSGASIVGPVGTDPLFNSGGFFNIGAGGNATFLFSHMFQGEASVWTHTTAANGLIEIQCIDGTGTPALLACGSNTGVGNPKEEHFDIMLPPRALQIQCFNNDAATKEFAFSIIGRPGYGGS